MSSQLDTLRTIKPKDPFDLYSDFSSSFTPSVVSSPTSTPFKSSEFQADPLAVWSIQRLQEEIINIPQGNTGYDCLQRSINRIKENIRQKPWGQKIILLWDARTTAFSTMSFKDFLRSINEVYFSHFPEIHQTIAVLLLQWNNTKSAIKSVMDATVVTCSAFSIRKMLDSKRFEQEKKGQIYLEGLSSKTRSYVMRAINESAPTHKGRGGHRGRGSQRGQYRGRGHYRGRRRNQRVNNNAQSSSTSNSQQSSQSSQFAQN